MCLWWRVVRRAQRSSCRGDEGNWVLSGSGLESCLLVIAPAQQEPATGDRLFCPEIHKSFQHPGSEGKERGRAESFLRGNAAVVLRCSYFTAVVGVSQGSQR